MDRHVIGGTAPQPVRRPSIFDVDTEAEIGRFEASALWAVGVDVAGTAAAKYSLNRGIDQQLPHSVRFIDAESVATIFTSPARHGNKRGQWNWWRWPAIMFAVTGNGGDVQAVHMVAIQEDGTAVRHQDDPQRKLKMTRGFLAEGAVRFPGDTNKPLLLAEGPENALSVWLPMAWETWSMVGGIGRAPVYDVPLSRTIVVCRDDEPVTLHRERH